MLNNKLKLFIFNEVKYYICKKNIVYNYNNQEEIVGFFWEHKKQIEFRNPWDFD